MKVVIIGARPDGHAKVVLDIFEKNGQYEVIGFLDDDPNKWGIHIRNIRVLGEISLLASLRRKEIEGAIVAIGNNETRRRLGAEAQKAGFEIVNAIHPTVITARDVSIGKGVVICAGAIINPGSKIGNYVTINTSATIDHDNVLEDGVNVSPGAHTSGRVYIREDAFIGTGGIIIPDICIGKGAVVGAGAVVIGDVKDYDVVAGVPARSIKK